MGVRWVLAGDRAVRLERRRKAEERESEKSKGRDRRSKG